MAVAMLAGSSAFAESRPSQETRRRGDARETVRRERSTERSRGNETRNDQRRESSVGSSRRGEARNGEQRGRDTYRERSTARPEQSREAYRRNESGSDRSRDSNRNGGSWDRSRTGTSNRNGGYDRNRGYDQNRGYDRNRGSNSHRGSSYRHSGRVTNYSRWNNGYRVWVHGAPYPFYIPLSHWHRDRFRIGVSINLGGYWNPGGYYDYYDDGYYRGYPYRATSSGDLRGTVESVDYRRDTFVVRNDATGSFVTVISRDRRMHDLRPGDYVEVAGSWERSGYFNAHDVDLLDDDRYRDRW
jgi:hypothetical protein